jgi:hypothetical protein
MTATTHRFAATALIGLSLLVAGCAPAPNTSSAPAPSASATEDVRGGTDAGTPENDATDAGSSDLDKLGDCRIVLDALGDLDWASGMTAGDTSAAMARLRHTQSELESALESLTHPDVQRATADAVEAIDDFIDFYEAVLDDPAAAADAGDVTRDFGDRMTQIGTVCS